MSHGSKIFITSQSGPIRTVPNHIFASTITPLLPSCASLFHWNVFESLWVVGLVTKSEFYLILHLLVSQYAGLITSIPSTNFVRSYTVTLKKRVGSPHPIHVFFWQFSQMICRHMAIIETWTDQRPRIDQGAGVVPSRITFYNLYRCQNIPHRTETGITTMASRSEYSVGESQFGYSHRRSS